MSVEDRVLMSSARAAKGEQYYGAMSFAAYPLLYAACVDLEAVVNSGLRLDPTASHVMIDTTDEEDFFGIADLKQEVIGLLSNGGISFSVLPYTIAASTKIGDNIDIRGQQSFSGARKEIDIKLELLQKMSTILNASIFSEASTTFKVLALYDSLYDSAAHFANRDMRATIVDGFLSIFQASCLGSKEYAPDSEVLDGMAKAADSDFLVMLTRNVDFGALPFLGAVGISITNVLTGDKTQLHSEMIKYTKIINGLFEPVPQPMICPFAVPLNGKVAETKTYYNDQLPQAVVNLMERSSQESGIRTAGRVLAKVFRYNKAVTT